MIPATVICSELEKAFKVSPPFKTTADKEDIITKDLLEIAGSWDELTFKKTMSLVRRRYKSFPTIEEIQDLYWQTMKEERPTTSEAEDIRNDCERRIAEENRIYSQIIALPYDEKREVLEMAREEIEAALEKLAPSDGQKGYLENPVQRLADLLRRHKDEAIKGRAVQIYRENWS